MRREDAGIEKVVFPKFDDLAKRYIEEISILKKSYKDEKSKILQFINEPFGSYPINRIIPEHLNKWKDCYSKTLTGGSSNNKPKQPNAPKQINLADYFRIGAEVASLTELEREQVNALLQKMLSDKKDN